MTERLEGTPQPGAFLSLQEIFDKALNGIRAQGGPSTGAGGACKYRGTNGRMCAVGQLIPDNVYRPDWDAVGGLTARQLAYRAEGHAALVAGGVNADDPLTINLLATLQNAHDSAPRDAFFAPEFERAMSDVAERFGLNYTPSAEVAC